LTAFLGDDELRKQEALEAAVAEWQGRAGGAGTCQREVWFGEDMRWEHAAESYQTQDLFASRKTLIVKNWDKLHASHQKHLEEVFRSGNPSVAVFLTAEKLDGRSALPKALKAAGALFEFKLPYEDKIPQWLSQRAREKYGRRLNLVDAQLLLDTVGKNLSELDHELEKLDTFLPKGSSVTAADIRDLVSPLKVVGIFEFQKTMGLRKKADMLPALRNLLENEFKDAPFVVAQMLFGHFLTLLKIRSQMDQGLREQDIVPTIKRPPFIVQKERYLEQAATRSAETWKKLLTRLARFEIELKQGRYPNRFEVEMAFAGMV
ncbi:MAG TPA: DNA polymerase III subunit delta, partial [Fibrobacteria bacterium]|nr:DNA polymerase III subunit delta [Fibrobacteria bacterium]